MSVIARYWLVVPMVMAAVGGDRFVAAREASEGVVSSAEASNAANPTSEEIAERMWKTIRGSTATFEHNNATPERARILDYWFLVWDQCEDAFQLKDTADDRKAVLRHFVDQFGRHGAEADMRWLLVGLQYTLPSADYPPYSNLPKSDHPIQMEMSELIVRRCLKDKAFLTRYYTAVIWADNLMLTLAQETPGNQRHHLFVPIDATGDGLKKGGGREYWWFARNFVLLAHAFGRDDMLRNADPASLGTQFPAFAAWVRENIDFMEADQRRFGWRLNEKARSENIRNKAFPRLSLPEKPFLDWPKTAPKPIRPEDMRLRGWYVPKYEREKRGATRMSL